MSRPRIVGVSGSTRRPSRTTALVEIVAQEVARRREISFTLFDLAEIGPGLGAFSRADLPEAGRAALEAIEEADGLIVGSPIYKGSYAGLFKHLFDFVEPEALHGRPVVLAATGGGRRHALAVEHQLRPLFGFFSALTLPTALYAGDEDLQGGTVTDPLTRDRIAQAAAELAAHAVPRPRAARLDRVA
ncbi:NADH-dependent FMN reductase SfnF [Methylobacterium crusticola]|uniref:NADH-dependent FMN reductase SfnF n=1 Tax=Methylobacterium crusticola TaxID=1697972 RepID=A0ABQ4R199_9HYPH|nr:FMN reductase [Methylobacterium crusticola]GJD51406.1 NADH-dependent FMN reductase SfnF [Methylobacterium crusticola]